MATLLLLLSKVHVAHQHARTPFTDKYIKVNIKTWETSHSWHAQGRFLLAWDWLLLTRPFAATFIRKHQHAHPSLTQQSIKVNTKTRQTSHSWHARVHRGRFLPARDWLLPARPFAATFIWKWIHRHPKRSSCIPLLVAGVMEALWGSSGVAIARGVTNLENFWEWMLRANLHVL